MRYKFEEVEGEPIICADFAEMKTKAFAVLSSDMIDGESNHTLEIFAENELFGNTFWEYYSMAEICDYKLKFAY